MDRVDPLARGRRSQPQPRMLHNQVLHGPKVNSGCAETTLDVRSSYTVRESPAAGMMAAAYDAQSSSRT